MHLALLAILNHLGPIGCWDSVSVAPPLPGVTLALPGLIKVSYDHSLQSRTLYAGRNSLRNMFLQSHHLDQGADVSTNSKYTIFDVKNRSDIPAHTGVLGSPMLNSKSESSQVEPNPNKTRNKKIPVTKSKFIWLVWPIPKIRHPSSWVDRIRLFIAH